MPFNAYSSYYDLLYSDKNYVGEVAYIENLLHKYGIGVSEILEFGSGTGCHGRLLAKSGYKVHGIELSSEMVSLAEQTDGFVCEQGDISKVQLGRTFDTVLSLFHVISYQITNKSVAEVFERAAEHLNEGGLFIFDVWYSPAVYNQRPSIRVKRMQDDSIRITRMAEPMLYPNENRVDVAQYLCEELATGHVQTVEESHPVRHFSLPNWIYLWSMLV